jgi:hypothetical protein
MLQNRMAYVEAFKRFLMKPLPKSAPNSTSPDSRFDREDKKANAQRIPSIGDVIILYSGFLNQTCVAPPL